MISIINLKIQQPNPAKPYEVRIDRTSSLGNIFILKDEFDRDMVCDRYQSWFDEFVLTGKQQEAYKEITKLLVLYVHYGKLKLFCWCAPRRCHGKTIKNWLIEQTKGVEHYELKEKEN